MRVLAGTMSVANPRPHPAPEEVLDATESRWLSLAALTAAAVVATLLGTTVSAHAYAVHAKRCSGYVACASLHVDHAQWAVRGASYADGLNVRYQYAMRTSLYECDSWDGYCALLERTDFKYQKGVSAMSNKTIWRHHGNVPGNCYKSYTDLRRRTNYGEPYVQIDTVLSYQSVSRRLPNKGCALA